MQQVFAHSNGQGVSWLARMQKAAARAELVLRLSPVWLACDCH